MIFLPLKSHLSSKLWKLNHSYSIFPDSLCGAQDHVTISPGSCVCDFFVSILLSVTYYFLSVINSIHTQLYEKIKESRDSGFKKACCGRDCHQTGLLCSWNWCGARSEVAEETHPLKQPRVWSYNTEQWDLNFMLSNVLKLDAKLAECF